MPQEFFPSRPKASPKIYAYILPDVKSHEGYIKVGYTERDVITRIDEQTKTAALRYKLLLTEPAIRPDGSAFTDRDVHAILRSNGHKHVGEWFKCTLDDIRAAIIAVRSRTSNIEDRTQSFKMRPEQEEAVRKTVDYFKRAKTDTRAPKFLWNAKMRFGKTFAAYELCKTMDFTKILVLTFKPVVESAWSYDLLTHVDFEGWQFVSNKSAGVHSMTIDGAFSQVDTDKPVVVFGSFQDLLGTNDSGGIKTKNEFIHATHWDIVIFDEYHFGAWRDNAKSLFAKFNEEDEADFDSERYKQDEAGNAYNETFLPITTDYYLFLSGTPFRALNSGEFIEEQIFNWTYSDEQAAKYSWKGDNNPYISLPRMVMMTYQIPESIRHVAMQGEFNEFDLNLFFKTRDDGSKELETSCFIFESEVKRWLNLIHGAYMPSEIESLKLGRDRPAMPFSDSRLLNVLSHTLWFLPNVASCYAMYKLLREDKFFHDYKIIICAGAKAGVGLDALQPVLEAIDNPLETKTITLSCGKLTTGVTVRAWTGVFMLRNLKSPETYFQTAFRVQSSWTIDDDMNRQKIMKRECYIFDFALDRALKQIADYSCRLNVNEDDPEKKVAEFMNFLPVLAYDGATMKQINAQDVLDITLAGTSATLLARRWESALLVNVDNTTLNRLLNNHEAMKALMNIEGFRSLNKDIETIINISEHVRKAKKKGNVNPKDKKKLTEEEKEYKTKRKEIQEKLIKFATRVPVFMYLTDFRERTLKDVITQLEPGLFRRVTGLNINEFELLCSLGVFNSDMMNDAIFKFKRYEDASLSYTGLDLHEQEGSPGCQDIIGGWDKTLAASDLRQ